MASPNISNSPAVPRVQITNPRKFTAILVGAAAIVAIIAKLLWGSSSIQAAGDFTVESGQAAQVIGKRLAADGYVSSTLPWRYAIWRAGDAGAIQAGTYRLEAGERIASVVERMKGGIVIPDELTITYPEGFTLQQVAARTAARGISTEEEFIAAAKVGPFADSFAFLKDLPADRSLEGYLFPDTYRVLKNDQPADVLRRLLGNFDKKMTPELRQEAVDHKRTLDEVVIMASIIEREINRPADLAKVADVLWKRFDANAGLAADATVRYILNKWDGALTVQDLAIDSPYNTRKYRGLPPTAIGNPGLTAILAALRPEQTDFYYYLSAPDGETIFAKTNDEHNRNKDKYLK